MDNPSKSEKEELREIQRQRLLETDYFMSETKPEFQQLGEKMEKHRQRVLQPDYFCSETEALARAMTTLSREIRKHTGYNLGWLAETTTDNLRRIGSPKKYSAEQRLFWAKFIHVLIQHGSNKAQAIKLIEALWPDVHAATGFERELHNSYIAFTENLTTYWPEEDTYEEHIELFSELIALCPQELPSNISKMKLAITALETYCQKIYLILQEHYELVRQRDTNTTYDYVGEVVQYTAFQPLYLLFPQETKFSSAERSAQINLFLDAVAVFSQKTHSI